ncbi:MAG: hypothetical protein GQ532_14980 [Methylomarinum sp.]|nr:hypothetical protein [Methylomarinum sp.]
MFGGIILNKANLTIIFQAFNTAFKKGLGLHESQWQRIATLVPSSAKEEKYAWLGQWPRLRKWIGDRQIKSLSLSDYSIKNEPFEATVAIPKDDIEDDSYGVYSPLMEEMGSAANDHPDELVFGLLGEGFTKPCFDGQFFFDTDHPVGDASVSNMQAGAGAAWFLLSTRRALKPIIFQRRKDYTFATMTSVDDEAVFMRKEFRYGIDARVNVGFGLWQTAFGSKATLDASNFEAAIVAGMSLETDEGRKLGIKYDLLVVGPGNFAAAKALIEKATLAGGEDNTNYKAVELLVVPWLN